MSRMDGKKTHTHTVLDSTQICRYCTNSIRFPIMYTWYVSGDEAVAEGGQKHDKFIIPSSEVYNELMVSHTTSVVSRVHSVAVYCILWCFSEVLYNSRLSTIIEAEISKFSFFSRVLFIKKNLKYFSLENFILGLDLLD